MPELGSLGLILMMQPTTFIYEEAANKTMTLKKKVGIGEQQKNLHTILKPKKTLEAGTQRFTIRDSAKNALSLAHLDIKDFKNGLDTKQKF